MYQPSYSNTFVAHVVFLVKDNLLTIACFAEPKYSKMSQPLVPLFIFTRMLCGIDSIPQIFPHSIIHKINMDIFHILSECGEYSMVIVSPT